MLSSQAIEFAWVSRICADPGLAEGRAENIEAERDAGHGIDRIFAGAVTAGWRSRPFGGLS